MTPRQLEILQHSLGVDQYGRGRRYRNFYCTDGDETCESLVALGFMGRWPETRICCGVHYYVTDAGIKAMIAESPEPPKFTPGQKRYREWMECADCFPDWKFIDYLKNRKKLMEEERTYR